MESGKKAVSDKVSLLLAVFYWTKLVSASYNVISGTSFDKPVYEKPDRIEVEYEKNMRICNVLDCSRNGDYDAA